MNTINPTSVDNLTIVISSCDKFSDLWDTHLELLGKNWPTHPPVVIVTDKPTDRQPEGVTVIAAGEGKEMPERLAFASDMIQTEYVLLTLDDYFPIKPVSDENFRYLTDVMDTHGIDYIRLYHIPNEKKKMEGADRLYHVDLEGPYGVNLYAGVWRKRFLAYTCVEKLTAWSYEVTLSAMAKRYGAKCLLSKRKEFIILDVVRKGKVLHKANRYLKKHGYSIGDRPLISYKTELKLFIMGRGKRLLPKPLGNAVKAVMRKCGHHFFSDEAPKE